MSKRNSHFKFVRSKPSFLLLCMFMVGLVFLINKGAARSSILQAAAENAASRSTEAAKTEAAARWNVAFWAVPAGSDSLFIKSDKVENVGATTNAHLNVGGAARSYEMTYTDGSYQGLATEIPFPGGGIAEGSIGLTAKLDNGDVLDTGAIAFRRFFVPTMNAPPIVSSDNLLEMVIGDFSLPADVYVLVMSLNAIPQSSSIPLGHQIVGIPYSVRSSGAVIDSLHPMILKQIYTEETLGSLDAHTLSVFEWDPLSETWTELGGTLDDLFGNSVAVTTTHFSVYALMATTHWRDLFSDFTGLSVHENTTILVAKGALVLDGMSLTGTAVSRLISPPTPIKRWGNISYTVEAPVGTSLSISVTVSKDNVLIHDVASGASLSGIDPELHTGLKLRANFAADEASNSPSLDEWQITWIPASYDGYLPLVTVR